MSTITITSESFATIGAIVSGDAPATLTLELGTPGPQGPAGPQGPQGIPGSGAVWGNITGTLSSQTDIQTALDAKLPQAGGYMTGDIQSSNDSAYRSWDGAYNTAVLKGSYLQFTNSNTGGNSLTMEWNGITFPSGKQTVHYPGTSILSGYATESWVTAGFAPIAAGQPTSGTVGQVLTKNSGTNYDSSWTTIIPGDRYVTTSTTSNAVSNGTKTFTVGTGLSYSSQQDVVISYNAANHMHAVVTSYDSGTGALVVDVQNHTGSGTYTSWTINVGGTTPLQTVEWGEILGTLGDQSDLATALNAKLETSTAASTYAALSGATFTGEVATPASTTLTAGFSIAPGTAPSSPANGEIWNTGSDLQVRIGGVTETLAEQSWVTSQGYLTSSALTPYLTSATAASTYQTISGMSSYLTTASAATTYAALAGATFTGKVNTVLSATGGAGFNLPHGAAPTTPVNGDIWTTTSGLFARINGGTQQYAPLGSTNTFTGTNTFSGATLSFGTSTAASTINIGTGATLTATTKAVNIGTAGVAGSTTNIAIGSATSTTTTTLEGTLTTNGPANICTSTNTYTLNLATGATTSGNTKTINLGTAGVAGSTTNITIGSTTGTSTTTLQGTTNGVTAAADTNSVALATTAYVVGQAGSATPLVDGTAAVGTSLRYARQDHVHPTDTTRAALASPTFTGTPAAPTAAVDTNTTQLATTAYVVGQGYSKLASPTFTGVPSAPTATAGTNTTQIATTAFVTAAVPAFASVAQVIAGTSSNTILAPSNSGSLKADPRLRSLAFINASAISGSGAATTSTPQQFAREIYLSSLATGRACFQFGVLNAVQAGFGTSTATASQVDFSKKVWISGYAAMGYTGGTSYIGDANTMCRISLGGYTSNTTGNMTSKGIGLKKVGGASSVVTLTVHNGTTLTDVASSVTVPDGGGIHWMIYSDGTGNVTLYINGTQAATTASGPTTATASGAGCYIEQVEAATTPTVRQAMDCNGGWFFTE